MRHSENTVLEGIVSLKALSYYNRLSTFCISFSPNYSVPLRLEINPINHNSSLQFSIRKNGAEANDIMDNCTNRNVIVDEHLTLAYF